MRVVAAGQPDLLARGGLAHTSLDDVMSMIGVSRQGLCLVLETRGEEIGRLVVKAGVLVRAGAVPDLEGDDALMALRQSSPTDFRVYRVPDVGGVTPLGSLAAKWGALPLPPPATRPRVQRLFRGRFHDVALADLLAVLSVSRQTLGVAFWRGGVPLGSWVTKAGQILDAELNADPGLGPREAFSAILDDPGDHFSVVELAARADDAVPFGTFFDLGASDTPQSRVMLGSGSTAGSSFGTWLAERARNADALRLVLRRRGEPLGELGLQDGAVHWARIRSNEGTRRGATALGTLADAWRQPGTTWELYRSERRDGAPLGSVVDLLAELRDGAVSTPDPTPRRLFGASFEQVPIEDLVAMLSVSRRRLGVVLLRGRKPRGGWMVKAGQVLDAVVLGQNLPPVEAFEALRRDPGTRFTVMEYPGPHESERLVGVLQGLWEGTGPLASEPPAPMRTTGPRDELLLEGSLHDAPLFTLLTSLSLTRQHLVIEVLVGRTLIGSIGLRSSQVLEVEHTSGFQRSDAFFRLLTSAIADRFRLVHRRNVDPAKFVPLGTLDEVLRGMRDALSKSGPRLVVPGEPELRAWLESEPESRSGLPADVDQESDTVTDARDEAEGVEDLGRRVSTLQYMLLMQGATIVMLVAVTILVILLAVADIL